MEVGIHLEKRHGIAVAPGRVQEMQVPLTHLGRPGGIKLISWFQQGGRLDRQTKAVGGAFLFICLGRDEAPAEPGFALNDTKFGKAPEGCDDSSARFRVAPHQVGFGHFLLKRAAMAFAGKQKDQIIDGVGPVSIGRRGV